MILRSLFVLLFLSYFAFTEMKKVLVIGGTGRVGTRIVSKLVQRGIETNVLVRDILKARCNPNLAGAILHQGDVSNTQDILKACGGCDAIIAVHGPKPIRFSRLTDLFRHPKNDPNHPYSLYFLGMKKILAAMELQRVPKLVRVTGALVGRSAFNPFVALFNIVLSGAVRWHEQGELAIRQSGVDYTVIRPPEIVDEPPLVQLMQSNQTTVDELDISSQPSSAPPPRQHLHLQSYEKNRVASKKSVRMSVSVADVADLCIAGVVDEKLSRTTLLLTKMAGEGPLTIAEAISKADIAPDRLPLTPRHHRLAAILYLSVFSFTLSVFARLLGSLTGKIVLWLKQHVRLPRWSLRLWGLPSPSFL
eukprot:gene1906-2084_t